jgi:hypothetical protein
MPFFFSSLIHLAIHHLNLSFMGGVPPRFLLPFLVDLHSCIPKPCDSPDPTIPSMLPSRKIPCFLPPNGSPNCQFRSGPLCPTTATAKTWRPAAWPARKLPCSGGFGAKCRGPDRFCEIAGWSGLSSLLDWRDDHGVVVLR